MSRVDLKSCVVDSRVRRRGLRRRKRWTVMVTHLPSGIMGAGLDARSYEEARDGAVERIESLLRARDE